MLTAYCKEQAVSIITNDLVMITHYIDIHIVKST